MEPVARGLAHWFRVFEPLQRGSGGEPLTVARHVADLGELVASCHPAPALVGHSWGAMLALAFAAARPEAAAALVLIGCGTFDREARAWLQVTREQRMGPELRQRLQQLAVEIADNDERLAEMGRLLLPVDSFELVSTGPEIQADARAHFETWQDMLVQQERGTYPAAFDAIKVPVLMLHGSADPHPGAMIRATLEPYLPQLEYHEWQHCGHYPWLERAVRDELFIVLRDWLTRHIG
jgi:pimeloyl-ACP methyl ester carboxylesterase